MVEQITTFGQLLKVYNTQKGWGLSAEFKQRKFIEITITPKPSLKQKTLGVLFG